MLTKLPLQFPLCRLNVLLESIALKQALPRVRLCVYVNACVCVCVCVYVCVCVCVCVCV